MVNEHNGSSKPLNDAQLQKELKFFLDCEPNFVGLFWENKPTLDAWKKVRQYFDYHLQQEMEAGMDSHADEVVPETKRSLSDGEEEMHDMKYFEEKYDIDTSDLPQYDENYTEEQNHQMTFTIFVKNLWWDDYYQNQLDWGLRLRKAK